MLDPNGSAMHGVGVEVRNLDAGWIRQMRTNESGVYQTASLPLGRYAVAAVLPNSEKIELGPIEEEDAYRRLDEWAAERGLDPRAGPS